MVASLRVEASNRRGSAVGWSSLAFSLVLHVAAIFGLGLVLIKKTLPVPSEQSIVVDILREPLIGEASSATKKKSLLDPSSTPVEDRQNKSVESPETAPETGGMVRSKELLSAKVLADPRSKAALVALRQLATDDRIIQLCNIEAMEQVSTWNHGFLPDFVVAYAMADTQLSGLKLDAEGGALRSKQRWYNIRFRCEVAPDLETVLAFEFLMGAEIPESEWAAHSLWTEDGQSD